jgi:hypothetical protein
MKIVIDTQHRENYAAHEEFTGEHYWKCKGGSTYVFPGFEWTDVEANKAAAKVACDLVSECNDYFEETVIDWRFEDDDEYIGGEYTGAEVPHFTRNEDGTWTKTIHVTDGHFHWGMSEAKKQWTLTAKGVVVDGSYIAEYNHPTLGWTNEKDFDFKLMDRIEYKEEIRRSAERGSVFDSFHLYCVHNDAQYTEAA